MDTSNSCGPNQCSPLLPPLNHLGFRVRTGPGFRVRTGPLALPLGPNCDSDHLWPGPPRRRCSRASDKLKIKARANKNRFKIFAAAKFRICCATRLRSPSQQCCLYHWNRRCVVRLNNIALFISEFSSLYLYKTL